MKKALVISIVTTMLPVLRTTAAEGGIVFFNYQAPYNPVVWGMDIGSGQPIPVRSTDGVQLTLWYGKGQLSADQLTRSELCEWNVGSEALGYAGFYRVELDVPSSAIPDWNAGDTYTFQIRASGNGPRGPVDESRSRSVTWLERDNILDFSGHPPGLPGISSVSIGFSVFTVPEPTALGLLTLGTGIGFLEITRRNRRDGNAD